MKKIVLFTIVVVSAILFSFTAGPGKYMTKAGHINFFSHTSAEDLSADNYKVTSSLDAESGEMIFSVPMQSFEFEKALMQKHYNSPKFMDTQQFPKAKFKGVITDLKAVDFSKDGTYNVTVKGSLTMHGETNEVVETGTITVLGNKIAADAKFNIALADYKVAFEKGKPSTNIAKEVAVTVKMKYELVQ